MSKPTFTAISNARYEAQAQTMAESEKNGECPFCWENLPKYHLEPILKRGKYWLVSPNHWPYDHVQHQWLFIYRDHIEHMSELPPEAMPELVEMSQALLSEHSSQGGALCMRFGDTRFSAGSVKHLHAQLIIPDAEAADFEPVRFKIGSKEK